jgi:hypothetical protein
MAAASRPIVNDPEHSSRIQTRHRKEMDAEGGNDQSPGLALGFIHQMGNIDL